MKEKIKFESNSLVLRDIFIEGTRDQLLLLQKALNKVISAPRPTEEAIEFNVDHVDPRNTVSVTVKMVEGK